MEGNLLRFSSIKGNLSIADKIFLFLELEIFSCIASEVLYCSCEHVCIGCTPACAHIVYSDMPVVMGSASLRVALIIKTQPASLLLTEV